MEHYSLTVWESELLLVRLKIHPGSRLETKREGMHRLDKLS
jgi:hypothetical protein